MNLPINGSSILNINTHYKIKTKNLYYNAKTNSILTNVNFEANPYQITAISGPSGAGKTTLLEILAGVVIPSSGQVFINDTQMDPPHFRKISGYVTQDDALFPLLTVRETLLYRAMLKVPKRAVERVDDLLKEMGLDHIGDVRIGDESRRGISGGEKRRVSIGLDFVHDPDVLFLDEPTSGLDSGSAFHVVDMLKSMARNNGKTIVLTIHQPGFRILEILDRVALISKGVLLHHGPLFLLEEQLKLSGHCIPPQVNVLEFAIDLAQNIQIDIEEAAVIREIKQEFNLSDQVMNNDDHHHHHITYPNPIYKEVLILSQRFSKNLYRNKQLFLGKILQAIIAGILLGTIFMNMSKKPKKFKQQAELGFFAFSLTFLMSSAAEVLPVFLEEKRILMRETSRGAYRVFSYVISSILVFLPFLLIVAFLFSLSVYWLVGLRGTLDGFLYFWLIAWMVTVTSNSVVACASSIVSDFVTGYTLIASLMGSFFLFSGYFISKEDVPIYWRFVHYLSLFKYPFEGIVINEFGGTAGEMKCLQSVEGTCLVNGREFLKQLGFHESSKWINVIVMFVFIIGYRLLSVIILCYINSRTRR
ncbi:ABC transporter G family member 10-like [Impatiens glandulifera]|uniref:ABC transporter G family member 10-like n=1 Tax=Impatiens glandulifera TaxID=253017 RepID=UPI001FB0BD83|nr:ABC transporter G family member 10-like [Impatiens glandulifera]